MFGYVVVNSQELKIKDFNKYRSYYCGLCASLRENYGLRGQMSLSYDMTFLTMLLTSLYEPETDTVCRRGCAAKPFSKHVERRNSFSDYTADMTMLLSYYKCMDDWDDEKNFGRLLYALTIKRDIGAVRSKYPAKCEFIEKKLAEIKAIENRRERGIDAASGTFGEIMAEVFLWRRDEWERDLREIGFFLGKFIYLLDAYDDLEEDRKSGGYNVLVPRSGQPGFQRECRKILVMMMSECARAFERLPLIENADILRNILYSGVWNKYNAAYHEARKRAEETKSGDGKKKGTTR